MEKPSLKYSPQWKKQHWKNEDVKQLLPLDQSEQIVETSKQFWIKYSNYCAIPNDFTQCKTSQSQNYKRDCGAAPIKMRRIGWTRKCVRLKVDLAFRERILLLVLLVLAIFCQISEECPVSCECKWKSGKESVICSNPTIKLESIPSGLDPGTQVLNLSGNKIQSLPTSVFLKLNLLNLQKIFLSNCYLKTLDRTAFSKLINLVELDLSGNRLEFVPTHTFDQIPELRELKINSNPIARISNDAFASLVHLVRLEMTSCRIGTIEPYAFKGLSSLEWLRLDGNRLFTIQATSFYPLKSLHGLEVHGNRWNCSCALQPLREWMTKNNVPYGVPPVCSEPSRLAGKSWDQLQLEDFACLPKVQSSSIGMTKVSKVIEGENATLLCRLQATADTQVKWWNGNKPVGISSETLNPHFLLRESFAWEPGDLDTPTSQIQSKTFFKGKMILGTKTSQLTVLRTRLKDSGSYSCRAESRAGSVSANFTLMVLQTKNDALSGRFLLYGAAIAALLTLSVCLLLLCVVFVCGRRTNTTSRVLTQEKLELNHIGDRSYNNIQNNSHPPGQNGGSSVPLISNNNHSNHISSPTNLNKHSASRNNATNNRGFILMGKEMNENNKATIMNSRLKTNTNYKAIPTLEQDSDVEDGDFAHENVESVEETKVVLVEPKEIRNKKKVSACSPIVSPSSSSSVISPNSNNSRPNIQPPLILSSEKHKKPPRMLPKEPVRPEDKKHQYPDLIGRGSTQEFSGSLPQSRNTSQPMSLMAEELLTRQMTNQHGAKFIQDSHPNQRGYLHRRVNSDSQSPLLNYGGRDESQDKKMSTSGYSVLSSSSNESPYGSTCTYQTPLSSSNRTLTSGKFSFHHPSQNPYSNYQQPFPPMSSSGHNGGYNPQYPHHSYRYPQKNPPFQRRSMPTSPVHETQPTFPYNESPYKNVIPRQHHSGSMDGGRENLKLLTRKSGSGSDPVVALSPNNDCDYDYHAAQLAAFLEEYRVLQMELMRMSASLQQVTDSESSPNKTKALISGGNDPTKNNANSSAPLGTNVNAKFTTGMNSSYQNNSLQQQQQLKSILKNPGNNNNYLA